MSPRSNAAPHRNQLKPGTPGRFIQRSSTPAHRHERALRTYLVAVTMTSDRLARPWLVRGISCTPQGRGRSSHGPQVSDPPWPAADGGAHDGVASLDWPGSVFRWNIWISKGIR